MATDNYIKAEFKRLEAVCKLEPSESDRLWIKIRERISAKSGVMPLLSKKYAVMFELIIFAIGFSVFLTAFDGITIIESAATRLFNGKPQPDVKITSQPPKESEWSENPVETSKENISEYEIIETSNIMDFAIERTATDYIISFEINGGKIHSVELTANFYKVEGDALLSNTFIGDVKESSYEVLYASISTKTRPHDPNVILKKGEASVNIVVVVPDEQKIYKISHIINQEHDVIKSVVNDSEVLVMGSDEFYLRLSATELWWTFSGNDSSETDRETISPDETDS